MKKVLLIRLDKIGDLICTMCVDQVSFLKGHDVQWVISKGLGFVPDHADPKRKYLELSKENWKESLRALRTFLHEFKPDVAVSFQAPWWVSYALWAENVPVRAGVKSQWHSFLFLNRGLRQRRSLATQHEADYNLDLLLHAFDIEEDVLQEKTPVLKLEAPENIALLDKYGLAVKRYVVVHPGMAGSALNWPIPRYIEFIEEVAKDTQVVLTGTPADEPWLKDIKERFKDHPRVRSLQNQLKAAELFTILKNSKAVVVPSTGVAHMAASLGATVLGIYSPLRVQHPRRWAARGKDVHIFVPEVADVDQVDPHCMDLITVEDLLKTLRSL
ncbi:glycosyltransferase family 9 protein [Bdellovibrio sp. 22V]|uniref:glycosyltransferase family 9 protein n=1 Tax=Bdellovibrio TaxID=958 RepID=UPI0025437B82|nr:glycosyltransferase family 9 protein [Bdellovibrio sp. 22V]WII73559.1 glycosyltransferase family 9 protein [Bdellovibrio sp. 22V]